ncbi:MULTISPECIES: hypothetical protein [Streptomyces]
MTRSASQQAYSGVRTRKQQAAILLLTLCTAGTVTACTSDSNTRAEKPSAPPSTADEPSRSTDPQAKEKKALLEVYERMWEEQVKAYARADTKSTDLKKYATANAFARAESDVMGLKAKGVVAVGEPTHAPEVQNMELDRKVPRAKLRDCMDTTDWTYKYRKSGKTLPLPKERFKRYFVTVKAERWGKQWMILDVSPQRKAC